MIDDRMHPRAAELVSVLGLVPHPEGGYFREMHRSPTVVTPDDGRSARRALTVIYFLLADGQSSAWHRVRSDEVWHFHEGDTLELRLAASEAAIGSPDTVLLGPIAPGVEPVRIVPAGHWQAARSCGAYTLVSCSVAPGFEFDDFEMRDTAG